QAVPVHTIYRPIYLIVFLFVSLSFIGGRVLERYWPDGVINALVWVGSCWLGAMLYFFLIIFFLDLIRLSNAIVHWYPAFITNDYPKAKQIAALISVGIVFVILVAARINAMNPRLHTVELTVPKVVEGPKTLNIAVASDIHLGAIIGRERLANIIRLIQSVHPDVVILAGDIVDEDIGQLIRENQGEMLREIKAPLGVYGITGNHEYFAGVEKACEYLTAHGITMLRDSVVKLNGSVYLVGREDRSARYRGTHGRKPLGELMAQVDKRLPIILLDHQPFDLEQADSNGADIQISGHTHNGQLWPLNYITERVYEVSKGYKKVGNTQVYVSTGAGTWGPPMRTGNRPEVVNIRVTFQ
ncbi:MAG TPA: metallophosphoesterase, partial [Candidatus Acidoferrum sp.]|nr:metallophosphoesterase [Candidatus Acidoferrum sp.]